MRVVALGRQNLLDRPADLRRQAAAVAIFALVGQRPAKLVGRGVRRRNQALPLFERELVSIARELGAFDD